MKLSQPKQHSGFSLLELLLVLAVIAIVVFVGIGRYQQHKQAAEIAIVEQNINLLFDALNIYYYHYCRQNQNFSNIVGMQQLEQANLMPKLTKSSLIVAGAMNGYDYQINAVLIGQTQNSNKPIYQLSITTKLNIHNDVKTRMLYQHLLNAKSANATKLTWVRLPAYSINSVSSNLWILNNSLRFFKELTTTTADNSCGY